MENFVRWREVLAPTGVYLLYWRQEVVYVGKSLNLFARLSTHYTNMRRALRGKPGYGDHRAPILFDDVEVLFLPIDRLDAEECRLILKHQPEHNIRDKVMDLDLTHIPAIQELLGLSRNPTIARRYPTMRFYERYQP